jgi:CRP/FNR family transcriptional regulator, cyclic AMP receptor protein
LVDPTLHLLSAVPLFQDLSKRELSEILAVAREVEFPAGIDIVSEGHQAVDFFLILDGEARVEVRGRRQGKKLRPGDYFGEVSVLDGGTRSATVTTETPVWALRLDRSRFLQVLDRHGSIGRKLLVEMSKRLRAAEGVLVHW